MEIVVNDFLYHGIVYRIIKRIDNKFVLQRKHKERDYKIIPRKNSSAAIVFDTIKAVKKHLKENL